MYAVKQVTLVAIAFIFTSPFPGCDFKGIMDRYSEDSYTASSELISSPHYNEASLKIMKKYKTLNMKSLGEKKIAEGASEPVENDSFYRPKNYSHVIRKAKDDGNDNDNDVQTVEDDDDDDEPNILCPQLKSVPPTLLPEKIEEIIEDTPKISGEDNESLPNVQENDEGDDKLEEKSDENLEVENVNSNKEEEKRGPAEAQEELEDNMEEKPMKKIAQEPEEKTKHQTKSWGNALGACLGFGDDFVIKILLNGAIDCKNRDDIKKPSRE